MTYTDKAPAPLTVAEVAARWQCSRVSVARKIRTGELPCLRLSKRLVRVAFAAVV